MSEPLPGLLPPPATSGLIRQQPEDFCVEEIPAYSPCGRGEHLLLEVQKRNRNTEEVIRALARHLGIPAGQVGCAGRKDRSAVTRQWLSVPAAVADKLADFLMQDVCILSSGLHENKLKTGHLKGNRFRIRLREIADADDVVRRCQELIRQGLPNYFGPQRFGAGGDNQARGLQLLRGQGRPPERSSLRFLLSAAQASLFNDLLALRIQADLFHRVLEGDVLSKSDTGGLFVCTDPAADQPRADAHRVHPTGPIFGRKMKPPAGKPAQMEREVLAASGLDPQAWQRYPRLTRGARRPLRVLPESLRAERQESSVLLCFSLPSGAYATSLLRELVRLREPNGF